MARAGAVFFICFLLFNRANDLFAFFTGFVGSLFVFDDKVRKWLGKVAAM